MNITAMIRQLERHLGYKRMPVNGIVGIGRNIEKVGLSYSEAVYLLENDIDKAVDALKSYLWYDHLSEARKRVVIDMVLSMGIAEFSKLNKFIEYLEYGEWHLAGNALLKTDMAIWDSMRIKTLADMIMTDGV